MINSINITTTPSISKNKKETPWINRHPVAACSVYAAIVVAITALTI